MRWHVYADLSRRLTSDERAAVFAALELLVPESGCVGPQGGEFDEVYFCVEGSSASSASEAAARYIKEVLERAGVEAGCELTLHPDRRKQS